MFSQSEHNTLFTLCFQLSLCYTTLVSKGCAAFILTLISESHTHPLFKWYLTNRHFLLEISWDYGRDGASQMANAGDIKDTDLIPGLEKSPGGGHGNPLQYSCLENPMDRGAWEATFHGTAKSQTWLRQLNIHATSSIKSIWKWRLWEAVGVRWGHGGKTFIVGLVPL